MINQEKLELVVEQLVENIESKIKFYSDEDREFFIENVVNIILLSEEDQVDYNIYCFLEHNYENYAPLQQNLNEGVLDFIKGGVRAVGRALGFGKPAEKIAFGAPPTTTVGIPGKDGKDGKPGGGGGGEGTGEGTDTGKKKKKKGKGDTHYHGPVTMIKGKDVATGDLMSGKAAKAGRDLTQVTATDNAQVQSGNVEDNRKQTSTVTPSADSSPTVALPNTQGQKAAAQARTRQSMTLSAHKERYGEEEGAKRYAAHREARRGQAANQRARAKASAANAAQQNTKQTATVDSKAGTVGDTKVGDIDFGAGASGHKMGDRTTTTPAPAKPEPKPTKPEPKPASTPAPAKKSKSKKSSKPVVAAESVDLANMYADYMNRFLKG